MYDNKSMLHLYKHNYIHTCTYNNYEYSSFPFNFHFYKNFAWLSQKQKCFYSNANISPYNISFETRGIIIQWKFYFP